MSSVADLNLESLEGRAFILGRQGHILINSPAAGRHHAELRIRDGKIYLRDLDSKNGLYLKKNDRKIKFKAGHVSLLTRIAIGDDTYLIRDLLAIASQFIDIDDNTTLVSSPRRAVI